jgi:16S rRNA processing protein RimM
LSTAVRDLVAVGKIIKVFGIRGEVILHSMTSVPARFRTLRRGYLVRADDAERRTDAPARQISIEHVSVQSRGVRLKLTGVDDRTTAERLVGMLLMVDENQKVRVPRGTWFVHDIIGMDVVDEEGNQIGIVHDVLHMPAQDVYVIKGERGEMMIPAVKEFILSVDVAAHRMRVRLIEGMLA